MLSRKEIRRLGEELACAALQQHGYVIRERNWRCALGEVDAIALDGSCWVFVEVRTRHGQSMGLPDESVRRQKIERLVALAQTYLAEQVARPVDWRIDLVAIELDRQDRVRTLRIIPGIGAT